MQNSRGLITAKELVEDKLESTKRKLFEDNQKALKQIRPIPTAERASITRKKMSASIISSTPVKEALEIKQNEQAEKEIKRKLRLEKKAMRDKTNEVKEKRAEKRKKRQGPIRDYDKAGPSGLNSNNQKTSDGSHYMCPGCNELYTDPPIENWIQCSSCSLWWHEECSSFEDGDFYCDFCI